MANIKANKNPQTSTVKLLSASKINELITLAISTTVSGLALLQAAAVQCMLHAEKHGDVTLAQRLMQETRDNCKGVVVAGFAKWFSDWSPIKMSAKDGVVTAELLKEGDEGYKPFKTAEAELAPALETQEVKNRSERPILVPSIAMFKGRIVGFLKQVDNFQATAPSDKKLSEDAAATIKVWLNSIVEFGNKVSVLKEEGKVVAKVPEAIKAAEKRPGRYAKEVATSGQLKTA